MKLAVQIALYRSSGHLPALLEDLQAQTLRDFEVFFYENSCDAGERGKATAVLEASGVKHHLLSGEVNIGFSGAHNALWRMHEAPFVLVLNDDVRLSQTFFEKALSAFERDHRCASVSGLVYRLEGETAPVATDATAIDTAGLEYRCLADIRDRFAGKTRGEVGDALEKSAEIFGVSGAAAFYRRSSVEDVSPERLPYDHSFFMYKEDVDLAIRLRRGGFVAVCEPEAVAFHKRSVKSMAQSAHERIKEERLRSPMLRRFALKNQWKLEIYHIAFVLGWDDLLASAWHEAKRKALAFVASPSVFFRAVFEFMSSLPASFGRRSSLKKMGLPHVRLRV